MVSLSPRFQDLVASLDPQPNDRAMKILQRVYGIVTTRINQPPTPIDRSWVDLENALRVREPKYSRREIRTALVAIFSFLRGKQVEGLPTWPLLVSRPDHSPRHTNDDFVASRWFIDLGTAWFSRMPVHLHGSPDQAAAAVILTAILRGDLTSLKMIKEWLASLVTELDPWLAAKLPAPRIALPEPLTRLALAQLRRAHPTVEKLEQAGDWVAALDNILVHLPASSVHHDPLALSQLLKAAQSWRRIHLPQDLQHATPALEHSCAPSSVCWSRLVTGTPPPQPAAPSLKPTPFDAADNNSPGLADRQEFTRLGAQLQSRQASTFQGRSTTRSHLHNDQIRTLLINAKSAEWRSPLAVYVIEWLLSLVERESRPPRGATIARYLSAIAPIALSPGYLSVVTPGSHANPNVEIDAWEALIDHIDCIGTDKTTPQTLSRWLRFLQSRYTCFGKVDLGEMAHGRSLRLPRAHVVTNAEFERAMDAVDLTGMEREVATLAAAVAQYAGPRRSELMYLRLADVVDEQVLLVTIRAHGRRHLKTRNARRDLPLGALLPSHWQHRLHEHIGRMQAIDDSKKSPYLFAVPMDPHAPFLRGMDAVVATLRASTGDPGLTLHSLRHSFATWAQLRLALYRWPVVRAQPLAVFRDPDFSVPAINQWVQGWLPTHDGRLANDAMQRLAELLGHGSPGMGLSFYMHLHGVIDRAARTHRMAQPPRSLLQALCNLEDRPWQRLEEKARTRLNGDADGAFPISTLLAVESALLRRDGTLPQRKSTRQFHICAPTPNTPIRLAWIPLAESLLAKWGQLERVSRCLLVDVRDLQQVVMGDRSDGPREPHLHLNTDKAAFTHACSIIEQRTHADPTATRRALACWLPAKDVRGRRRVEDENGLPQLLHLLSHLMAGVGTVHITLVPMPGAKIGNGTKAILEQWLVDAGLDTRPVVYAVGEPHPEIKIWPKHHGPGFQGYWVLLHLQCAQSSSRSTGTILALDTAARFLVLGARPALITRGAMQ